MDSFTSLTSASSSGSKNCSDSSLNYSLTSTSSSKSSQSTSNSSSPYTNSFWSQYLRQESPTKKKSFWNLLKQKLSLKDKNEKNIKVNSTEKLIQPSHPEGLYCVIDQFLSTYSDGYDYSDEETEKTE